MTAAELQQYITETPGLHAGVATPEELEAWAAENAEIFAREFGLKEARRRPCRPAA